MQGGRFWLSGLAVFITSVVYNLVVHGVILFSMYETYSHVFRAPTTEERNLLYLLHLLAQLVFALMFVYIFTKGYEGRGWAEGIRYGVWVGLLIAFPAAATVVALFPLPLQWIFVWTLSGLGWTALCGLVTAAVYRGPRVMWTT
ncbi:MAG: hypothetical protein NZ742_09390 [Acidobacteria bacterium]|nr:hypothetical protein [Acidobacteriota bacterium]MDW7984999.1 hypothetical protein [Acidobacteriota bacterium]